MTSSSQVLHADRCTYDRSDYESTIDRLRLLRNNHSCVHVAAARPEVAKTEVFLVFDSNCHEGRAICTKPEGSLLRLLGIKNFNAPVSKPQYVSYKLSSARPNLVWFENEDGTSRSGTQDGAKDPLVIANFYSKGERPNLEERSFRVGRAASSELVRAGIGLNTSIHKARIDGQVRGKQHAFILAAILPTPNSTSAELSEMDAVIVPLLDDDQSPLETELLHQMRTVLRYSLTRNYAIREGKLQRAIVHREIGQITLKGQAVTAEDLELIAFKQNQANLPGFSLLQCKDLLETLIVSYEINTGQLESFEANLTLLTGAARADLLQRMDSLEEENLALFSQEWPRVWAILKDAIEMR